MPGPQLPHPPPRPHRRRPRRSRTAVLGIAGLTAAACLSAAAAAGAAAAPAAAPAPAAPPAAAHAPRPAVTLFAAASSVQAQHSKDSKTAFVDFGLNVLGGDRPISVVVHRPDYAKRAVATLSVGKATRKLGRGMAALYGLRDFVTVTVTDAKGKVVSKQKMAYCPGGGYFGGAVRGRPDAPSTSPYPSGCAMHPFALGMVAGLQAGWLSPVYAGAELKNGSYTVNARLGEPWRKILGVPVASARTTLKVKVVTGKDDGDGVHPAESPEAAFERAHEERRAQIEAFALASGHAKPLGTTPRGTAAVARAVPAGQRPDLRALPSTGISLVKGKDLDEEIDPKLAKHQFLVFSATVWNAGTSPLVVEGFRKPSSKVMTAYQYFYAGDHQIGYAKVGTIGYDTRAGHQHWHFTDFAQYNLLDVKKRQAIRSQKEAFCLAPTDAVDLTRRGARWQPGSVGLYSACGEGNPQALALRENLDAGWGDTYSQYRPGQSFDIETVPNGTYYVEVLANPKHRLLETSTANNRSLRKIVLGGTRGHRTVKVPPVGAVKAT
jgi:hypothetical protein